jgi:hypothetical protein
LHDFIYGRVALGWMNIFVVERYMGLGWIYLWTLKMALKLIDNYLFLAYSSLLNISQEYRFFCLFDYILNWEGTTRK